MVEMLDLTRHSIVTALGQKVRGQLVRIPRPEYGEAAGPVQQKINRIESLDEMAKMAQFFNKWSKVG